VYFAIPEFHGHSNYLYFLDRLSSALSMTETSFGNRISQTFPNTVVTWELEKIDNDKTRLKLSHIGFNAGEIAKKHDEGWFHFLNELTKYCQAVRYSH
jgi:hypothetical protein